MTNDRFAIRKQLAKQQCTISPATHFGSNKQLHDVKIALMQTKRDDCKWCSAIINDFAPIVDAYVHFAVSFLELTCAGNRT